MTWRCKKQNVARSSAETEYRAMAHTTCEFMWIQSLLSEMGAIYKLIVMYCDNQAAMYSINNPVFHKRTKHIEVFHERTKHIEVECHFIRDMVMRHRIVTPFVTLRYLHESLIQKEFFKFV